MVTYDISGPVVSTDRFCRSRLSDQVESVLLGPSDPHQVASEKLLTPMGARPPGAVRRSGRNNIFSAGTNAASPPNAQCDACRLYDTRSDALLRSMRTNMGALSEGANMENRSMYLGIQIPEILIFGQMDGR